MTKDSIWAAMGPSGSLSDDTCLSFPSWGLCVPSVGGLVLLWSGPEPVVRPSDHEGMARVGAPFFRECEALVEDLHIRRNV